MTKVFILLGITLLLLIVGIVMAKVGSNKCKMGFTILGAFIAIAGGVCGFFAYESYILAPVDYSVSSYREVETGYQLTLNSNFKGMTGGTITISKAEALNLGLIVIDEKDNEIWVGGNIKQNRDWIAHHRS